MFKVKQRHQNDANDVVLVSLLLTLNIFHTLFWYFYLSRYIYSVFSPNEGKYGPEILQIRTLITQ